jgi:hypothetical protein
MKDYLQDKLMACVVMDEKEMYGERCVCAGARSALGSQRWCVA